MNDKKKGLGVVLAILAALFGAYVISPDPLPIVVDDIGSLVAMIASIAGAVNAFKGKKNGGSANNDYNDVSNN